MAGASLRDLLSQTAGLHGELPPGAAPYAAGLDWLALALARACLATAPVVPRRKEVRYSTAAA